MDTRNCGFCEPCAKGDFDNCATFPGEGAAMYTYDGVQVTPAQMWDRFIAHIERTQPLRSGEPHKNFIGSIAGYRKLFIAAQEE